MFECNNGTKIIKINALKKGEYASEKIVSAVKFKIIRLKKKKI